MITDQLLVSLAYFDNVTIEDIAGMDLSADDLRRIAGKCGQWAYETAVPSVRSAYLERANTLTEMADLEGAQVTADMFVQDVHFNE